MLRRVSANNVTYRLELMTVGTDFDRFWFVTADGVSLEEKKGKYSQMRMLPKFWEWMYRLQHDL